MRAPRDKAGCRWQGSRQGRGVNQGHISSFAQGSRETRDVSNNAVCHCSQSSKFSQRITDCPCQGGKPECEGHVCALLAQDQLAADMHRSLLHNIRADFQDFVVDLRSEEISISCGCVSRRVSAHFFLAVCHQRPSFHSSPYPLQQVVLASGNRFTYQNDASTPSRAHVINIHDANTAITGIDLENNPDAE